MHTIRLICDFMLSSESKKTPRSRTTLDGDMMSDPTRISVSRRDFPEVCGRPKPHHFGFLCVQLKALPRAPLVHRRHTSSKPISDAALGEYAFHRCRRRWNTPQSAEQRPQLIELGTKASIELIVSMQVFLINQFDISSRLVLPRIRI